MSQLVAPTYGSARVPVPVPPTQVGAFGFPGAGMNTHRSELKLLPELTAPPLALTTSMTECARIVSPKSSLLLRIVNVQNIGSKTCVWVRQPFEPPSPCSSPCAEAAPVNSRSPASARTPTSHLILPAPISTLPFVVGRPRSARLQARHPGSI